MSTQRRSKVRRYCISIPLIFFLLILIWPAVLFYPMGALLYRNDEPAKQADSILILMGSPDFRPEIAAKAMIAGLADRIIFVTPQLSPLQAKGLIPSEENLTLQVLEHAGVSREKILIIRDFGLATSTIDEALAVGRFIDQSGMKLNRLVAVTSWGHTMRAGWVLDKALKSRNVRVEMLPVEKTPFDKSNWWQSEDGLIFVFEEYIKWSRYLVKYLGRELN